jgi:hypothetical protein
MRCYPHRNGIGLYTRHNALLAPHVRRLSWYLTSRVGGTVEALFDLGLGISLAR